MNKQQQIVWRIGVMFVLGVGHIRAQTQTLDLGEAFKDPARWEVGAESFVNEFQWAGFRYVDGRQIVMSTQRQSVLFLGLEVYEARMYFEADALRRMELSIYNKGDADKGDAGLKKREAFEALAKATKQKIDAFAQNPGMSGKSSSDRPNYIVQRHQWIRQTPGIQLEWAYVNPHREGGQNVEYSAEVIRVLMIPGKAGAGGLTATTGGLAALRVQSARAIKENVTRNPEGDVWIDNVPMVDQGEKGYCAAASSERVLRYYGVEIDQHQIAQLANTAAEGGTTLEGMAMAISKVGRQFRLDKKDLISVDSGGNFEGSEHMKMIAQYNAEAKRRQAPMIDWKAYTSNRMVDLPAIWAAMKPDILLAVRRGQTQGMNQFVKDIKQYTDQGVPLLWSCLVGMYAEKPPLQAPGLYGHTRLIIGYNTRTQEVLYSDTWGPSHALKRLPLDQAWAMTKGLTILKPRSVR